MEIQLLKEQLSKNSGRFGDRRCDLTVIRDQSKLDRFTNELKLYLLTDKGINLWKNGCEFEDLWPKSIIKRTY